MDTGLDAEKTASKIVVHKTDDLLNNGNIVIPDENSGNVQKIIIAPEKTDEILSKLRKVLL